MVGLWWRGINRLPGPGVKTHVTNPTILLVAPGDDREAEELAFELAYLKSLTTQQRFELMFRRSREIAEMLLRHGYRKPVEITRRA